MEKRKKKKKNERKEKSPSSPWATQILTVAAAKN